MKNGWLVDDNIFSKKTKTKNQKQPHEAPFVARVKPLTNVGFKPTQTTKIPVDQSLKIHKLPLFTPTHGEVTIKPITKSMSMCTWLHEENGIGNHFTQSF